MFFFSNKITVADSGLFAGITDMHSHILPGVDDGVKLKEDSLKILSVLESQGLKELWFTPHVMEDVPNHPENLKKRFKEFQEEYKGGVKIHLAAENMLDGLFKQRLSEDNLLFHKDGELLVETSYYNPPFGLKEMISAIKAKGYYVLLAHPERYRYMDEDDYKELKEQGIRFQLNLPSLVGAYGLEAQKKAESLLIDGMYDCYGTDLHSYHQLEMFLASKIKRKFINLLLKQ